MALVSGTLLIISLFLPWYSAGGRSANAWQSMAVDDVILLVTGTLAIVAAMVVSLRNVSSLSVAAVSLAILPAVVSVVLVAYRIVSPAPPVNVSLGVGAWLALAAALGTAVGAWTGAKDEGPARRNAVAERKATEDGLRRAELLELNAPLQK